MADRNQEIKRQSGIADGKYYAGLGIVIPN